VTDCAITGTASGNGAKWYEVTKSMYALPLSWSTAAYLVNIGWWNKLDPAVRDFMTKTMKDVENAQWALGTEATEDGIACNSGNAAGCKIGAVVTNNPMTITRAVPADQELLRKTLVSSVLPAWVKRCGARCGEIYNEVVAPITGVKFTGS
jgi:TRAP-type C4-dicarboxylate transport system substrate-binding protein